MFMVLKPKHTKGRSSGKSDLSQLENFSWLLLQCLWDWWKFNDFLPLKKGQSRKLFRNYQKSLLRNQQSFPETKKILFRFVYENHVAWKYANEFLHLHREWFELKRIKSLAFRSTLTAIISMQLLEKQAGWSREKKNNREKQ